MLLTGYIKKLLLKVVKRIEITDTNMLCHILIINN